MEEDEIEEREKKRKGKRYVVCIWDGQQLEFTYTFIYMCTMMRTGK